MNFGGGHGTNDGDAGEKNFETMMNSHPIGFYCGSYETCFKLCHELVIGEWFVTRPHVGYLNILTSSKFYLSSLNISRRSHFEIDHTRWYTLEDTNSCEISGHDIAKESFDILKLNWCILGCESWILHVW